MGSPYFVHAQSNDVHVVRTARGFERILKIVCQTMGYQRNGRSDFSDPMCPEEVVLRDLSMNFLLSQSERRRIVLFLEARYEWTGWKKFQRVIVFDPKV